MSTYTVQPNQSIYDVAIAVHGSIDGVADLLVNNKGLNMYDNIDAGEDILFTNVITLNKPVVDFLDGTKVVAANIGDSIKYREAPEPIVADIFVNSSDAEFMMTKTEGDLWVDWGDESEIEFYSSENSIIYHQFDISTSESNEKFKIRFFGKDNLSLGNLLIQSKTVERILLYKEIPLISYTDESEIENPTFISLTGGIKNVSINNATSLDFGFLGLITTIRDLDLRTKNTTSESIDSLFLNIVNNYASRLPAVIKTKIKPNGVYQAPKDNGSPKNGMEAVWVLINSEQWNTETHKWKIEIDGVKYEQVVIEEKIG